jgi:hypothetical protein
MRAGLVVLLLLAAAPAQGSETDFVDRLVGTWSCETDAHTSATLTFVRNVDGSVSMKNVFKPVRGRSGEFAEQYRFDPRSAEWTWVSTQPGLPGWQETATAWPWAGDKWIFQGRLRDVSTRPSGSIGPPRTTTREIRMVYTDLGDAGFRREFEQNEVGTWVTVSASTCKRASP